MKSRFTALDVRAVVAELQELTLLGLRVVNVYDVDNKTYLIRLAKPDLKKMLLFESGIRIHSTDFEWPKPNMPSQFSLKCRKHLKSRRLVSVRQLGGDRIIDLQFGTDEAAYHLIVELYDRGNVVLTDHQYTILNLLRRRKDKDNEDVRFAVRESYPLSNAREAEPVTREGILSIVQGAQAGDTLRKILSPHYVFGPQLMDHCLRMVGHTLSTKITAEMTFLAEEHQVQLFTAMSAAEKLMQDVGSQPQGFIIQKERKKPQIAGGKAAAKDTAEDSGSTAAAAAADIHVTYDEFHPILFSQHSEQPHRQFQTLNQACDEYFSKQEEQKIDVKQLNQEKQAVKKLDNVRKDIQQRVDTLQRGEEESEEKAGLIEMNVDLVERALLVLNSAIASAADWADIAVMIREAKQQGDPVASTITDLRFERNAFVMSLRNPFEELSGDEDDDDTDLSEGERVAKAKARAKALRKQCKKVEIDLSLTAYANAKRYYDSRRYNAQKKEKTLGSSSKALKSAEKKTRQIVKDSATIINIRKSRKFYWFEKFLFFFSSENFMVIGGRDQQQNEIIVRRYLKPGDVYVHADLHGATSCVIKNHTGAPIPPKTLNEAGVFALCHSSAWQAKIVTSAWWVYHHQVSKTAPTGEYLTTGSFMIRGKKNFLPPTQLVMGFGFMFKVDESSLTNHLDERRCNPETAAAAEASVHTATTTDNPSASASGAMSNTVETATVAESTAGAGDIEGAPLFPDTVVDVRHTGQANKYQYQISVSSTASENVAAGRDEDEDIVYLGDNEPVRLSAIASRKEAAPPPSTTKAKNQKGKGKSQAPDGRQSQTTPDIAAAPATTTGPKRGKKAKLRKAQERYADQDEEEKEMRMKLLQSAGPSNPGKKEKGKRGKARRNQKSGADARDDEGSRGSRGQQAPSLGELLGHHKKAQAAKQAQAALEESDEEMADLSSDELRSISPGPIRDDSEDDLEKSTEDVAAGVDQLAVEGDDEDAASVNSQDEQEQGEEDEKEEEKEEENRASGDEAGEDDTTLPSGEQDSLFYSSFTGCPREDDILLFAMPVVAPYASLQNFKYKVKITPGNEKRGRAAKHGLDIFLHAHDILPREKDLLRVVKDNDMSRAFPGPVQIAGPQLTSRKGRRR